MKEIIETRKITKDFVTKSGVIKRSIRLTRALDEVDISIHEDEIFGLIGESGSGKTTLGLTLLKLLDINSGSIKFMDEEISSFYGKRIHEFREKTQMVFQDPYSSLNPIINTYKTVVTPLKVFHKEMSKEEVIERVLVTLERVGLSPPEQFLDKFPGQLSGGQKQRVGIARAIINEPKFLVADEPVSMLDVSLRADILNILLNLRNELHTSMLFISHDIAVTQYVSDRIAVLHLGQIVELADSALLVKNPMHPYTKTLIESVPVPDPKRRWAPEGITVKDVEYVNEGRNECSFANRCPFVMEICRKARPEFTEVERNHFVACYLYGK